MDAKVTISKNNNDTLASDTISKTSVAIGKTKKKSNDQIFDATQHFESDRSLESYPFLNSVQKELITQINTNHPQAIEKITTQAITVVTKNGRFELPLEDTKHPVLKKYPIAIDSLLEIDKLGLARHDYYTGHAIEEYYKSTGQQELSLEELESIIMLMPAGDAYNFGEWGEWSISIRQFTLLLGLTEKDLTGQSHEDIDYLMDLGEFGIIWIGVKGSNNLKLRICFDSINATHGGHKGNSNSFASIARLIKKLSS